MLKIILQDQRYHPPIQRTGARLAHHEQTAVAEPARCAGAVYPPGAGAADPGIPCPKRASRAWCTATTCISTPSIIQAFLEEAQKRKSACRAALSADDPSFREHALPLSNSYTAYNELYLADLWYFPDGIRREHVDWSSMTGHRAGGDRSASDRGGLLPCAHLHGIRAGRPGLPGAAAQPAGNRFVGAYLHRRRGLWVIRTRGALRRPAGTQRACSS